MKGPSIGWYAKNILQKSLYAYQQEVGNAILDSVLSNRGLTITVMMARQMGKNEISAVMEAYLLSCMEAGNIVKVAPTFKKTVPIFSLEEHAISAILLLALSVDLWEITNKRSA